MNFSQRSRELGVASSIQQNELVYEKINNGLQPIILSYGEAPFRLDMVEFSSDDWERGCHYSEGMGVPEFRQELAGYIKKITDVDISWQNNILVSAGSKIISYFIAQAVLDPGDAICLHEPSWVSYQEHARLNGANTFFLPYEKELIDIEDLCHQNKNIKLIYLNNPNNPRGHVYRESELRRLAKFCQMNNIILALDESYSEFVVNEPFFSGVHLIADNNNVVVFNSMSKNYGLSGWRIGYCVANSELIQILNKFNQHLITCAPTNLQLALVGKLENLRDQIKPQLLGLNQKRFAVNALLDKYGLKYLRGSSTFYIFIDISDKIADTKKFVIDFLNDHNVSLIPGGAYGQSTSGFLRLSFAIESIERIEEGIKRLVKKLEEY